MQTLVGGVYVFFLSLKETYTKLVMGPVAIQLT